MSRERLFLVTLLALVLVGGRVVAQDDGDQCLRLAADGTWQWIACPPDPPHTATPSDTPTPTASPTPTDTATPPPTATPDVVSTPTPETTPPVPTPGPTVVPKQCTLRADGFNIRVRSGPGTGYAQTGLWDAGTERVFDAFQFDDFPTYLWGRHSGGWSAIYLVSSGEWWVNGTEAAVLCVDVGGWPEGLAPPAPIAQVLDGFHLIVGAVQTLLDYSFKIGTIKGTTHADQIPLMAKQINPEIVTVFRSLYNVHGQQDCPSPEEWYDAEDYLDGLLPFGLRGSITTSM